MARRPVPIKVKPKDLTQIVELLRGGIQQVRVVLRALVPRQLADGVTAPHVAQTVPLTPKAIRQIAHRYNSIGLNAALYDKQRPGAHEVLDVFREATHHCHGLQSSAGRPGAVDGALGCGRSRQAQTGAQGGPRNNPDFAAEPRVATRRLPG